MVTRQQSPALGIFVMLAATLFAAATAHAKKPSDPGVLNAAMIASDPMSPVNPFNSGADPLTMPGDARIGVFPYSRDQIFRVLTAPLKLTTIELEPGEKLITD